MHHHSVSLCECELYNQEASLYHHFLMLFMVPNTFICRAGFATYLVSILLFLYVIRWGAIYLLFTGLLMVLAAASYGLIILNDPPLQIHFQDDILIPHFKAPFFLVLFTGLGASILAVAIVIADYMWPRKVAQIFHHSIIEDDVIFQVTIQSLHIHYWHCNLLSTLLVL